MRILAITNLYPPHHVGGYELGCQDVIEGLRTRGHSVHVLTSTYGVGRRGDEGHIHRWLKAGLHPEGRLQAWVWATLSEIHNQAAVRRAIRQFNPDLVYVWNIAFVSLSTTLVIESLAKSIVYYVSDQWPTRWWQDVGLGLLNMHSRSRGLKALLGATARAVVRASGGQTTFERPSLMYAQFTSDFIRCQTLAAGYTPTRSWIIPWAVDPSRNIRGPVHWPPRRVLYAGRLAPCKGVHTALAGFVRVARSPAGALLTLTVAGGAALDPAYERILRQTAADSGLGDRITFRGQVPREELARLYLEHDIFVLPSEWDEPFSIALVEAMAAGLAVVATVTGGTGEIVVADENAVVYPAGDPDGCCAQLTRLVTDRRLYESIRQRAFDTVRAAYLLPRMIDSVEASLSEVVGAQQGAPTSRAVQVTA